MGIFEFPECMLIVAIAVLFFTLGMGMVRLTFECPEIPECRESFLYEKLIECKETICPKIDPLTECIRTIDEANYLKEYINKTE